MRNIFKSNRVSLFLGMPVLFLLVQNCAPVAPNSAASVNLGLDLKKYKSSALSAGGNTYTLPTNVCYAVHIHGTSPAYNRLPMPNPGDPAMCPKEPPTFGRWVGFYNKGASAEIVVTPELLNFDLVGVQKSDLNLADTADCPAGLSIELAPDPTEGNQLRPKPMLNGSELDIGPNNIYVIATGAAQIVPGNNNISLQGVVDPTTNELGIPYFCDEGGSGGGGYYASDELFMTAPTFAGARPSMSDPIPQVHSGLVQPFMTFDCPIGATHVSVQVAAMTSVSTTCNGGTTAYGGVAHFPMVQMPAGYGQSVFGPITVTAQALDSANTQIGQTVEVNFNHGWRYYQFKSFSYFNNGSGESPVGSGYGTTAVGATYKHTRFAGYRNVPGERYLFINRVGDSVSTGNNNLMAIKLKESSGATHHPFDWDGSVANTSSHVIARDLPAYGIGIYNPYQDGFNFVNTPLDTVMTSNPDFTSYSTLLSSINNTATDMLGGDPGNSNSAYYDFVRGLTFLGSTLFVGGERYGSVDLFRMVSVSGTASPLAIDHYNTGSINRAGVTGASRRMFNFESFVDSKVYVGAVDVSIAPSKVSLIECATESSCSSSFSGFFVSDGANEARAGTVVESMSGAKHFLVARNTSMQRIPIPSTAATFVHSDVSTGGVQYGYTSTNFVPPVTGGAVVSPEFMITVEKTLNGSSSASGYDFDVLMGGSVFVSTPSPETRAVMYRSPDGGQTWYLVYKGAPSTKAVDATLITRQMPIWDQNGPTGYFDDIPGVAVMIETANGASFEVLWQEHMGY